MLDEYYSESLVLKGERKIKPFKKFSFGYGTEYKYDWGYFENRGSYTASTRGHMKDFGIFSNLGYKFYDSAILSIYARSDDHNTTGGNQTYKLNFTKIFDQIELGLSHSTGLRNPSLYELYGSNGRTDSYKHVANPDANPEKSRTNELKVKYSFNDYLNFENTFYRSFIEDALLYDSSYKGGSGYTNNKSDLKQDGIESNIVFKNNSNPTNP